MTETITILIKSSTGKKLEVSIATDATVEELKTKISEQSEDDLPVSSQRLIYSGRVLKDNETIEFYKIKDGHTVHLVKSVNKSAAAAPTPAASTTDTSNATPSTAAANAVPSNIATGTGSFNPLADLTGARYAGYAQLPSASMFGPDSGMTMPDPEEMERMLSNPMVQQSMNEMLSNPQMVDFLINQSPGMRALGPQARELLQSEQFRTANPFAAMFPGGLPQNPFALYGNPQANTGAAGANLGGANDAGLMQALMASLGGNGGNAPAQEDNRPPEERYESQLRQLNDMGFNDFERNVAALRRAGGSVQGAIENLLNGI
ncbi:ubiquitin domain-containing protein DSK2 CYBJADRAFT_64004 [Cyberlindnera jadinii NRRL Y-1542]|uniref:Ubiquitin-domain-containing protein n=1 Tax=Cyberlindnera jadinii (strain ATCC 18201 / CBS 1600 / BCRC 20928 / JCM 3617 / NBRC 0987 / NRRL Y-1542) TaxID=983966 RepID=A0A1E4S5U5_CYBJN|nr:hypothetical protein CYBJADRAFT_64004 [Cyberlindnera jadinii NRRL Y-1542]ODV74874.1 hypothetical protein CYBJADRAFT_64004 [Cyberlindnera jadinii NRRL Y-1542]